MPRYIAPNHKDCWIDCPASGYAIFVPPHGPCEKGCDEPGAALAKIVGKDINIRFAFRIKLTGRSKFVRLCMAISGLDLKNDDRESLSTALSRVKSAKSVEVYPRGHRFRMTKSSRGLRLMSEHSDATISTLIDDIVRATGRHGSRGGGPQDGGSSGKARNGGGVSVAVLPQSPYSENQRGLRFD